MSVTIKVFCTSHNGLQTNQVFLNGSKSKIKVGETDIDILIWLKIKKELKQFIDNKSIYVEPEDELRAINEFRTEQFSHYRSIGVPAVRASVEYGDLEEFQLQLAKEWLEVNTEAREDLRDSREAQNLSISRKALYNSKCANVIAAIAIIIAVIGMAIKK